MDDLKARVKAFLDEFEFTYLKRKWVEQLIEVGIDEREAHRWAAELGHVVDEYQTTLMLLAELFLVTDPEQIPQKIYSWAVGIQEVTVPEIAEPMKYLAEQLEEYLPPDDYDDEGDEGV
jgi:hypothetical protein